MPAVVNAAPLATVGATSSIVDLPDDIISDIFKLCSPCTLAHVLSSICARFRAIALDTPSLWTTIRFQIDETSTVPRTFERDAAYLQRSGEAPLDVDINWARSINYVDGAMAESNECHCMVRWLSASDVNRALRLLWPHLYRIRTLALRCDFYFPLIRLAETFTSWSAPALEVLELTLCATHDDNTRPASRLALFTEGMPMLKHVTLHGVHWDWVQSPLGGKNLKTLRLNCMHPRMCPNVSDMLRIIRASPDLEELTLLAAGPQVDVIPAAPCVAQSLRSLTLGHASAATLNAFPKIAIANALRWLILTDLISLPHASAFACAPITYLTLQRITAAPCTIVDFLRVGFPKLRSLTLRELQYTAEVFHGIARRGSAVCPKLAKLKIAGGVELEDVHTFLALRATANVAIAQVYFEARDKVDKPKPVRADSGDDPETPMEECSAGVVLDEYEAGDQPALDLLDV